MQTIVGIDFGVSFVTYHVPASAGQPPREGRIPNVVAVESPQCIHVGDEALRRGTTAPDELLRDYLARFVHEPEFSFRGVSLRAVTAAVFRHVAGELRRVLPGPLPPVALAVPVWFDDDARSRVRYVAEGIGLSDVLLVDAPVAAARDWEGRPSDRLRRLLVYDLDGPTFSAALLELLPLTTPRLLAQRAAFDLEARAGSARPSAALPERTAEVARELLHAAGITWKDVDHVRAVGGEADVLALPAFWPGLAAGRPVRALPQPEWAVARGAARMLTAGPDDEEEFELSPLDEPHEPLPEAWDSAFDRTLDSGGREPEWSPPAAQAEPARPPYLDENVQFTVYRPKAVAPARWYPLLAFAHLSEKRPDAEPDEPDPVAEVQNQARQALGARAADYQNVTQDSRVAVPREGEITLVPDVPGVVFNPPRRSFLWLEGVHREEFRLRAGAQLLGKTARGRLTVFLGSILLAEVSIAFRVEERPAEAPPDFDRQECRPYRKIFASYSHRDEAIVKAFDRYARALGDRYLRDWTDLRSGEVWSDRLAEMIREADVFQLFWSWNSMHSAFVRQEWEYALTLNRSHFVRPLYWDEPLPAQPEKKLPPEELSRLHFMRVPVESLPPSATRSLAPPAPAPPPAPAAPSSVEGLMAGPSLRYRPRSDPDAWEGPRWDRVRVEVWPADGDGVAARQPVVVLLDTSAPAPPDWLPGLKQGLDALGKELRAGGRAAACAEIAVVTFGGRVKVAQQFVPAAEFAPPALTSFGLKTPAAAVEEALALLEARRQQYQAQKMACHRPWVVLFLHAGQAPETPAQWRRALEQMRRKEAVGELNFFVVLHDEASGAELTEACQRPPAVVRDGMLPACFAWLGASLRRVIHARPGEVLALPEPDWQIR